MPWHDEGHVQNSVKGAAECNSRQGQKLHMHKQLCTATCILQPALIVRLAGASFIKKERYIYLSNTNT